MHMIGLKLVGRGAEPEVDVEGENHIEGIRRDLGPDDAEHAENGVEEKEHGDVEKQPPGHAQEEGHTPFAEGLEQVHGEEAQEHQRGGQHPDTEELGGQLHRLGVSDEQVGELDGENLIEHNADGRYDQP